MSERPDVLVIGGGFYGLYLAEYLAGRFDHVILCEARSDLMQRASYANQARVHAGYHYPRSLLTAARSRANFPRFVDDFRAAIDRSFDQLYAISLRLTKVSAEQFRRSMHRIGAVLRPALPAARQMFDRGTIEDVFRTQEHAFNALVLKQLMRERAEQAGVEIRTHTPVFRLRQAAGETVEVELGAPHGPAILHARHVFCCVYSQVNAMLLASGLELIPLKHELAELALVALPKSLAALGITVMDGPFFSCMPFPALGLHTLSHVRYTPHFHWYDSPTACSSAAALLEQAARQTAYPHMIRDASRYVPALRQAEYRGSLWEVKTLLPRSEIDDSRPILFKPHHGLRNFHVVIGGKIDNVYDVVNAVAAELDGD